MPTYLIQLIEGDVIVWQDELELPDDETAKEYAGNVDIDHSDIGVYRRID